MTPKQKLEDGSIWGDARSIYGCFIFQDPRTVMSVFMLVTATENAMPTMVPHSQRPSMVSYRYAPNYNPRPNLNPNLKLQLQLPS